MSEQLNANGNEKINKKTPDQIHEQTLRIVGNLHKRGLSLTGAEGGTIQLPNTQDAVSRKLKVSETSGTGRFQMEYGRVNASSDDLKLVETTVAKGAGGDRNGFASEKVIGSVEDPDNFTQGVYARANRTKQSGAPIRIAGSYDRAVAVEGQTAQGVESSDLAESQSIQAMAKGLAEVRGTVAEAEFAEKQRAVGEVQDVLNLK